MIQFSCRGHKLVTFHTFTLADSWKSKVEQFKTAAKESGKFVCLTFFFLFMLHKSVVFQFDMRKLETPPQTFYIICH